MGLVEVTASNYIVMHVGECVPKVWGYQEQESDRGEDFVDLYKVKGMPVLSKEMDTIDGIEELVVLAKEGKEIEIIIDEPVEVGTIIMVQEVLNHGHTNVGTYKEATPEKNELGEAKYTGIVMDVNKDGNIQIYTLFGNAGQPKLFIVNEGLVLQDSDTTNQQQVQTGQTLVKLGGAIRFIARDEDITKVVEAESSVYLSKIDVINKYV